MAVNQLGNLFSDIAAAIRGKTGDTGTMKPIEFPEKIASIEAGGADAPTLLENVPVDLDFSNGDQTFSAPDGYAVKSGIVRKPETLVPENVRAGVEIAGIEGEMESPELLEDVPIALDFSSGNQVFSAPNGMAVKSAIVQKPASLTPENIAKGVNIAGIIGALAAGGGGGGNMVFKVSTVKPSVGQNIPHGLGVIPDIFILYATGMVIMNSSSNGTTMVMYIGPELAQKMGTDSFASFTYGSASGVATVTQMNYSSYNNVTDEIFRITKAPLSGYDYTVIAIGGLT